MNIAFTLCSNNYLSQAKVVGDSFIKHHPDFEFFIGLVDEYSSEINYGVFKGLSILPANEVPIPKFKEMEAVYNIVEFNTAVKPFYFSYFFEEKNANKIIYLDPDILIYSRFEELLDLLDSNNIVVTPQACTPIDDGHAPTDVDLLGTGVFNLGFLGLSNYNSVKNFLEWWSKRLEKYCFDRPAQNMFFDQLWINLVPAFFDNYYVLRNFGYNMAAWNMHERTITNIDKDNIYINGSIPLRFFHYSGYKFTNPDVIVRYSKRYSFETRPDVKPLFSEYQNLVMNSKFLEYSKVLPAYCKPKVLPTIPFYKKAYRKFKKVLNVITE